MARRILVSLALLILIQGCVEESKTEARTFTADTLPQGRVVVENSGAPAWPGGEPWVAVEDLRIGAVDGGGPTQFGFVIGLEIDGSGRIFVADAISQEIRVFFPDGGHAFNFGRKGEGPGEFLALAGLQFDPAGRLWTRDNMNMRYSVFSADGSFLFTHPMRLRPLVPNWEGHIDAGGRVFDWSVVLPFRWEGTSTAWKDGASAGAGVEFVPILSTPGESREDTFPSLFEELEYMDGGMAPKPFSSSLVLHTDSEARIWTAYSKEYEILLRRREGDTTLVFTLPATPEPVTEEEKLQVSKIYLSTRRIPLDQILDEKPIVELITSDQSGHLYIFPHLEGIPAGTAVDAFLDSGVFLGRILLPVKVEMRPAPVIRLPFLYGITKDEYDVQYVVALRLGPVGR